MITAKGLWLPINAPRCNVAATCVDGIVRPWGSFTPKPAKHWLLGTPSALLAVQNTTLMISTMTGVSTSFRPRSFAWSYPIKHFLQATASNIGCQICWVILVYLHDWNPICLEHWDPSVSRPLKRVDTSHPSSPQRCWPALPQVELAPNPCRFHFGLAEAWHQLRARWDTGGV